jgi:hypothetical protein
MPNLPEPLPWNVGGGNLAGQETGRQHLSHTALAAFLSCPEKFNLSYEQRLRPIATPQALTLGKAYQLSIEHNDSNLGADRLRAEHGPRVSSQQHEDRLRTWETIVASASALYLSRWGHQATGIREFEYRVRLRNPRNGYVSRTYDLLGYADEYVDLNTHAALVENKLVGQISELSIRKLPLDRQIALACYGTWRATGLQVREVFYRFVRKPSIKQRKDESIEEFCERLAQDYLDRPDFYAHEEHILRSSDDLVRVEAELWEWASQLRRLRAGEFWPRNTSACVDFGGCAFMGKCLGEPGADGLLEVRPQTSVQGRQELPAAAREPESGPSAVATVAN